MLDPHHQGSPSGKPVVCRFPGRIPVLQYAVRCTAVRKTFRTGRREVKALDGVDFEVRPGEMVALIGASGSGKSTLLRHISGLAAADHQGGRIEVLERPVQDGGRVAGNIRRLRQRIGFIFQQFNLVGRLSLLTNVLVGLSPRVPLWRAMLFIYTRAEKKLAMQALHRVGIHTHAAQRANTLSGGQQQRAAIARAMVQGAEVILADEPIASLDPIASRTVMELLADLNRRDGTTVVVSLHQVDFARKFCPRIVAMSAGRVVYDGPASELDDRLCCQVYGDESGDAGLIDGTQAIPSKPAAPTSQPSSSTSPSLQTTGASP